VKKLTKDERMEVYKKRTNSAMSKPNRTDDLQNVLVGIDVRDFFKTTIEKMTEQEKRDLYIACEALDKNDLEKLMSAVGQVIIPRLREWKVAQSNINTSIEAVENGLAMKFVDEFMTTSQMNWNAFYTLFYPAKADILPDDDDDM
jgi:hypothetical protein